MELNTATSNPASIEPLICRFVADNYMYGQQQPLNRVQSLLASGLIDSVSVLELTAFLEETFAIQIEDQELVPANLDSIAAIAAFVARKRNGV